MPSAGKVRWDHGRGRVEDSFPGHWGVAGGGGGECQHPGKPSALLKMRIWDLAGTEDHVTPCSLEGKGGTLVRSPGGCKH